MAKPKTSRTVSSAATDHAVRDAQARTRVEAETVQRPGDFQRFVGLRSLLNPLWCFHGFRLSVIILTLFGVIMVFSSSSVNMIANGLSPWAQALKQGGFCVVGFVVALLTMMVPASVYRRISFFLLCGAMALQALTLTPLGVEVNGNKGWIGIKNVFTIQPAEIVKLALCVWMPCELIAARKRMRKEGFFKAYRKLGLGYVLSLGLVMSGKDLGTCMILLAIGAVALILGDFPGKWLALIGALGVALVGARAKQPESTGAYPGRIPDLLGLRPARRVLSGGAWQVCHRLGRPSRCRHRQLRRKMGISARSPQ